MNGLSVWIRPFRERADAERARARRAAEVARRHERLLATVPESVRPLHERMVQLHRKIEERHLTAASLHDAHVERLSGWFARAQRAADLRPRFISAVADLLGVRSAGITLLTSQQTEAAVISSDDLAAAAQDLEFTLGEGPVHEATSTRELVVAAADSLPHRWRHYSPAVLELGFRSLAVAPLGPPTVCFGALAVFDLPTPEPGQSPADPLLRVADALTHAVLLTDDCAGQLTEYGELAGDLLNEADHRAVVYQAVGVIAAQCNCTVDDALALLKARAFAQDEKVETIARQIMAKQLRLDNP